MGRKSRRIRDLLAEVIDLSAQLAEAEEERDAALHGQRVAAGKFMQASAAVEGLRARNRRLTDLLTQAREAQGDEEFAALEGRVLRAVRACARYRAELGTLHAAHLDQVRAWRTEHRAMSAELRTTRRRLDDALGYDAATDARLDAGAHWQDRRADAPKPHPDGVPS